MRSVAICAFALVSCKQDATRVATCPPLAVSVDGKPLPAMPHGLAKANNMNGDISYEVQMFDHANTTCADVLDKTGRRRDGEHSVRAFAAGAGMTGKGVGVDAHTQMGGNVTLLGAQPKAAGDVVRVCADNVAFKPIAGVYKDKHVVITGLFEGKYCGETKW